MSKRHNIQTENPEIHTMRAQQKNLERGQRTLAFPKLIYVEGLALCEIIWFTDFFAISTCWSHFHMTSMFLDARTFCFLSLITHKSTALHSGFA